MKCRCGQEFGKCDKFMTDEAKAMFLGLIIGFILVPIIITVLILLIT
jgi:hypothetical protein